MKRYLPGIVVFLLISIGTVCAQQRVVADCTVTYAIRVDNDVTDKDVTESLKATTKTLYIRGNNSRMDLVSPAFKQSLIYDKGTTSAVVLREFGNSKLMTRMNSARWIAANKMYDSMTIVYPAGETKNILGYECRKAVLRLKDGSSFMLYYAPNIVPSVKEFQYQFKDIPGFVLEYEAREGEKGKIVYTATKINISPVPVSKFEVPTAGYRLLD
jgi:hypothetical protein